LNPWNSKKKAKMVLAQLGGNISRAIQQMSNATIIDEKALNDCLNEITRALLQSDVQFKLVRDMLISIKSLGGNLCWFALIRLELVRLIS
jgi:signal recognition particle GTPase